MVVIEKLSRLERTQKQETLDNIYLRERSRPVDVDINQIESPQSNIIEEESGVYNDEMVKQLLYLKKQ